MSRPGLNILLAAALLASVTPGSAQSERVYRVVVHPDNHVESLDRDELSRLFLKRSTRWESGAQVLPVDLVESSTVREAFSQEVHRRRTAAVKSFWQQMIFSGRSAPPPEVESDSAVIGFVRANPGAIGYVSSRTALDGVREVPIDGGGSSPQPGDERREGRGAAGSH